MKRSAVRWRVALLLLVICPLPGCGDATGVKGPAIRVLSGEGLTDTVEAFTTQPLLLEILGAESKPAKDVQVWFNPFDRWGVVCRYDLPSEVGTGCSSDESMMPNGLSEFSDASGHVSKNFQFGRISGTALVELRVPELGLVDTVSYTVLAGNPDRVVLEPDTAVTVGTTTTFRPGALDRFLNRRPELGTLSTSSSALLIVGQRVEALRFGSHPVDVHFPGLASVTATVRVVPAGMLAAVVPLAARYGAAAPDSVVVAAVDGSQRRAIPIPPEYLVPSSTALTWSPDGTRLVVQLQPRAGGPSRLYSLTLDGKITQVLASAVHPDAATDQRLGAFSRDGRWLFFTSGSSSSSTLWRAPADLASAEPVGSFGRPFYGNLGVSPDGARVALPGSLTIYDVAARTETNLGVDASGVAWSPTDDRVAYRSSNGVVGIVNADGTGNRVIAGPWRFAYHDPSLAWSPDGRYLLCFTTVASPDVIDPQTGVVVRAWAWFSLWSPTWKP